MRYDPSTPLYIIRLIRPSSYVLHQSLFIQVPAGCPSANEPIVQSLFRFGVFVLREEVLMPRGSERGRIA
jgi:hypothetical protein